MALYDIDATSASEFAAPKAKITEVGQPCRHCAKPVVRREHKTPPTKRKGGYYYAWWLACPYCHALYMVESAKVMLSGAAPVARDYGVNQRIEDFRRECMKQTGTPPWG